MFQVFNLEQSEQELTARLLKQEKEVVLLKGEMKEQEEMLNQPSDDGSAHVGDNIFLINQKSYACIKNCIEDTLFECDVKGDT